MLTIADILNQVMQAKAEHYRDRTERADSILNDDAAIRALTRLETEEMNDDQTLSNFQDLCTKIGLETIKIQSKPQGTKTRKGI